MPQTPKMQHLPRVAALHDLSGFGRASLTVAIPILSSMGIQVCPLPTAVLSTHTVDYFDYTLLDTTSEIGKILDHWERLNLKFDAVYSGFMANPKQMDFVARCIDNCLAPHGLALVDPVLGDNGILDQTMTPQMVEAMRGLVKKAKIITPNFTEAAFLLGEKYKENASLEELIPWLEGLMAMGPDMVAITSVPSGEPGCMYVAGAQSEPKRMWSIKTRHIPAHYPGTGDAFASVLLGFLLKGEGFAIALDRAVNFVNLGIRTTFAKGTPTREGIALERILNSLNMPLTESHYLPLKITKSPAE